MADETPEQIKAHRDQLKSENDRLNPENDGLKQQVASLTESLKTANELTTDLRAKLQAEQAAHKATGAKADAVHAKSAETIASLQKRFDELNAKAKQVDDENRALVAAHDRKAGIHSTILKLLMDDASKLSK